MKPSNFSVHWRWCRVYCTYVTCYFKTKGLDKCFSKFYTEILQRSDSHATCSDYNSTKSLVTNNICRCNAYHFSMNWAITALEICAFRLSPSLVSLTFLNSFSLTQAESTEDGGENWEDCYHLRWKLIVLWPPEASQLAPQHQTWYKEEDSSTFLLDASTLRFGILGRVFQHGSTRTNQTPMLPLWCLTRCPSHIE